MERPTESLARLFRGNPRREDDLEAGTAIELPEFDPFNSADVWAEERRAQLNASLARDDGAPALEPGAVVHQAEDGEAPGNDVVPEIDPEQPRRAAQQAALAAQQQRQEALTTHLRQLHPQFNPNPLTALRRPKDVDLAFLPKQLTPTQNAKKVPVDLKQFPEAKSVRIYVIKGSEKDDDTPPTPPVYAVPVLRRGETIFVEFKPDETTMATGQMPAEGESEGDGIGQMLEFDFVTNQWTTPAQRMASQVLTHARMTERLKMTLQNDEIRRAEQSDSVHAQIEQIQQTLETNIAQFYEGLISFRDLCDQVDKKCEEVAKLASEKKTRAGAAKRQWSSLAVAITAFVVTVSFSGTFMVTRMLQEQNPG